MSDPSGQAPDTIAVVVPAFNESRRIGRTLRRIDRYAVQQARNLHVIVVDDHSADGTPAAVAAERPSRATIELLVNDRNRGKGYSVRRGVLHACDLPGIAAILFTDADLSTPIEDLDHLLVELEEGAQVAIGSRLLTESHVDPPQPPLRRALSWLFRTARRALMLRYIRDTQCGFKLFSVDAARELFSRSRIDGFAFDCELLAIATALGYRVVEVGVTWHNDARSTLRPARQAVAVIRDLLTIRARFGSRHRQAQRSAVSRVA